VTGKPRSTQPSIPPV